MAHNLSWIDPEDLRALVSETAYRRPEAELPAAPPRTFTPGGFVDPPPVRDAAAPRPVPTAPPLRPTP